MYNIDTCPFITSGMQCKSCYNSGRVCSVRAQSERSCLVRRIKAMGFHWSGAQDQREKKGKLLFLLLVVRQWSLHLRECCIISHPCTDIKALILLLWYVFSSYFVNEEPKHFHFSCSYKRVVLDLLDFYYKRKGRRVSKALRKLLVNSWEKKFSD